MLLIFLCPKHSIYIIVLFNPLINHRRWSNFPSSQSYQGRATVGVHAPTKVKFPQAAECAPGRLLQAMRSAPLRRHLPVLLLRQLHSDPSPQIWLCVGRCATHLCFVCRKAPSLPTIAHMQIKTHVLTHTVCTCGNRHAFIHMRSSTHVPMYVCVCASAHAHRPPPPQFTRK